MCGFAGALMPSRGCNFNESIVSGMCQSMLTRGPDAFGYWTDALSGLTLGHRRLSIIDLDDRANQPMISDDGCFAIVFNGEIYNFRDLRLTMQKQGETFDTESDTEVLLKLYRREGEGMLNRIRGMFALAIWDKRNKTLFLARDPYGIKPLYFAQTQYGWLFASQVKGLLASGLADTTPDQTGRLGFWLLGSVPEPYSWFRGIRAVPAGSWCLISCAKGLVGPQIYRDIGDSWVDLPRNTIGLEEAQEIVRDAVTDSVLSHMVADVPVGVFLSGGIDSGCVAGLMRQSMAGEIKGITIAFEEFQGTPWDEIPASTSLARQYDIDQYVRVVTAEEFRADLPSILASMDQPSIDGINTWYASKAAAELGLKVVLSGVGGDELFFGYPSFKQIPSLMSGWKMFASIPGFKNIASMFCSRLSKRTGNSRWNWFVREVNNFYGAYWLRRGLFSPDELRDLMGALWDEESLSPSVMLKSLLGVIPGDPVAAVGQVESRLYLRNQLLRDSDWASMAHSVELRTPLVDAWLLAKLRPVIKSFGALNGKNLLANSPNNRVNLGVINRSKTGFGIPLGVWIRDSLSLREQAPERRGAQGGQDSRNWAKYVSDSIYQT